MKLTCIVCPNSCTIFVDGTSISGYKCKRGLEFAKVESIAPTRTVTGTVKTVSSEMPVLSVKTSGPLPKSSVFDLMAVMKSITVDKSVDVGDVLMKNVLSTDIDIIATAHLDIQCVTEEK